MLQGVFDSLFFDTSSTAHAPHQKALKFAFGNPGAGPPCLAAARSRFGSYIINVIHYQNAVSLPSGEGFTKMALLPYIWG